MCKIFKFLSVAYYIRLHLVIGVLNITQMQLLTFWTLSIFMYLIKTTFRRLDYAFVLR
jgi:hypothetical protein